MDKTEENESENIKTRKVPRYLKPEEMEKFLKDELPGYEIQILDTGYKGGRIIRFKHKNKNAKLVCNSY